MKAIAKKALPLLITLALTTGCCHSGLMKKISKIPAKIAGAASTVKDTVLGEKYEMPIYDETFRAKGPSSKSKNGLEVFAAKYNDKKMYSEKKELFPFIKGSINDFCLAWEIILKDDKGELHRLTNNAVEEYHPKIDPEGKFVIFERNNKELYKIDLETRTETKLTNKTGCKNPAISPDGEQIAFNYNGDIWLIDKDGKNERELLNLNVNTRVYEWTEKGLIFAYGDSHFANAIIDFENKEVRDYHIGQE